jgi:DNA-binding NarL/FixJ family response regulator
MTRATPDARSATARILIIDDHPVVCEGLAALIARQAGLVVCGTAQTIPDAIQLIEATEPDLCIVDIGLKGGSGIDLIKRLKQREHSPRFLVSSMHEESLYAERALRAGAMGYIHKQEATRKIIDAIHRVLDDKVYLSDAMTERLLHQVIAKHEARSPMESLADRELEVFELIGQGLNTRQIAAQLHLSPKTVETYRSRIRLKLNIGSGFELNHQAMQWVLEHGDP